MEILWAPAATASCSPRRLGTSTATTKPFRPTAYFTTAAVSAELGYSKEQLAVLVSQGQVKAA